MFPHVKIHLQHRKLGVNEKLKLAKKAESLNKGYELVTWAYDPPETVNGYLNFHKLGQDVLLTWKTAMEKCRTI
ncbi:hypothetical protein [Bacillus sp. FJAT-27231]|uniref:hypothetical protein n=1 Tax=Bacillus sp. FJAT-27231 TaxID=1679168 RepID=UPI0006711E62|nr:hypothetical protein [Bacillus sp. FJAT-27231]